MSKILNTCRLEVKAFEEYELNYYFAILQDNNINADFIEAKEKFKEVLTSDKYYAITLKLTKKVIGYIYVNKKNKGSYEVGYLMSSAYQNSGYATEALDAVATSLQEEGADSIIGNFKKENVKQFALLSSLNIFSLKDLTKIYAFSKE